MFVLCQLQLSFKLRMGFLVTLCKSKVKTADSTEGINAILFGEVRQYRFESTK